MGLQRKIRLPDTQFLQNEYLRASFFPIDPYSSFYALFVANLVSHNTFFLHRPKMQNAHGRHFRIYNSLVISSGFHNLGISNKTSLPYPQAFHSVGISSKTSFPYPQTFIVWVSATKQASHTHKLFTLRRKKGTDQLDPISCAHTEAKEWVQAELVRSTAILRYEPCPQFINVSQRALHIYWQFSAMSHAIHKIVSKNAANLISYRGVRRITA